jgi:hypothetical protein
MPEAGFGVTFKLGPLPGVDAALGVTTAVGVAPVPVVAAVTPGVGIAVGVAPVLALAAVAPDASSTPALGVRTTVGVAPGVRTEVGVAPGVVVSGGRVGVAPAGASGVTPGVASGEARTAAPEAVDSKMADAQHTAIRQTDKYLSLLDVQGYGAERHC